VIHSIGISSATRNWREPSRLSYVLITPARNEEAFIEQTVRSVIGQTVLPRRWVVVSDGSTDGTNEIVRKYASQHRWMELVILPARTERHFAGKVHAFNAGYERVRSLQYEILGSLDADVTFDCDYFEFLLDRFAGDPELGLAGTPFREGTVQYDYRFSRKEHVSGACQLFRRECFESIGGYVPLNGGGIDLVAVVTARMRNWKTETFTEKFCVHHRPMGSAKHRIVEATFKSGYGDYLLGVHPLWQLFRSAYQMSRKPVLLGGAVLWAGYMWAMLKRPQRQVTREFVRFRRKEQKRWLKEYFRKWSGLEHWARGQG
jgi:poly-beta-1,6-N-acetyl-D-glucosamine synthase